MKLGRKRFVPRWRETPPREGTYRSIFKWGAPDGFKHPNKRWYEMLKKEFGLTDAHFESRQDEGDELIQLMTTPSLPQAHLEALRSIVGPDSVSLDAYSRLKYSRGKSQEEILELRKKGAGSVVEAVVHPHSKEDVGKIVAFCNQHGVPIYTVGAGSSVNGGLIPTHGGIALAMATHMNRVLAINETNQTVRVQPGILGPAYEQALREAPAGFGTKRRYTGGHFPQSFQYSSVGGWILMRGSGQASTYYGDACELVLSTEFVTPVGTIRTLDYPSTATGPRVNDMLKGSEGVFGILVEATMKIFRYLPENRRYFSFMFPGWESAVDACREIVQGEFGRPAVLRISDAEETERGMKLFGLPSLADNFMRRRGYAPDRRCLCIGTVEGERDFTRLVQHKVRKICKGHGAFNLTSYATKKWDRTRFTEPYMREDLNDYGIILDTLETPVTWDNVLNLHAVVRERIKRRANTVCMTHASHFYPQGTNLYFIFILKAQSEREFVDFKADIIDTIIAHGGSPSHHHGIGKMMAPWMEGHLGTEQMNVLRALKHHFDPNGILNPGGQLGLDLPEGQRRVVAFPAGKR
jgi:alkyldihydroxyacetonephosphate synthase